MRVQVRGGDAHLEVNEFFDRNLWLFVDWFNHGIHSWGRRHSPSAWLCPRGLALSRVVRLRLIASASTSMGRWCWLAAYPPGPGDYRAQILHGLAVLAWVAKECHDGMISPEITPYARR